MKKIGLFWGFLLLCFACRANGGDAALGGFAGSMVGSMVGTAVVQGGNESRARREAREARRETEALRRDQQRERMERLEQEALKKSINEKDEEIRLMADRLRAIERGNNGSSSNFLIGILVGLIGFLLMLVMVLGFFFLRKK